MRHTLIRSFMTRFFLFLFLVSLSLSQIQTSKPIYKIETTREGTVIGSFTVELFPLIAPKAVAYFDSLVAIKFYDSLAFHRVVPAFVIQGGDPNSKHLPRETWGNGDPSQTNVPAEFNNVAYARGILGAARDTDPNSANSQFFICVANAFSLNAQYTAYGKVVSGMNVVDTIVAAPRDANDNPLKKIEMFITKIGMNDTIPAVPVLINPAPSANRITLDSNLIWSAVSGAVLYRLEIALDSNFSTIVFATDVGTSSYTLKSIQLGLKKYYWRVSANNGGHLSGFSQYRSFTSAVSIPALQFPVNGSTNQPGNVWIRWNSTLGAVSYHLQVSTNSIFSQAGIVVDQKGITDTVKQMSSLQLLKKHYWRVSAETPEYEGAFGLQWTFTTGTSTNVGDRRTIPERFLLEQNFPNPFNPTTILRYGIPVRSTVKLIVFNTIGQTLAIVCNGIMDAGYYDYTFDAKNLSSGAYLYRIEAVSEQNPDKISVNTKKMVLMK
jgi:peptidyl-prolyl cis-trans isomerase B (cyclophilin B)